MDKNKFEEAFNNAHEFSFDKFRFDEPDYNMLIVEDETDFLDHLRVQSAGLAYYGAAMKDAEREYEEFEKSVKWRYNEMYSDASDCLLRLGKKNNVKDIEAHLQTKYEAELKRLKIRLSELKKQRDYITVFYEGWKQKSFLLSSMTNMITSGLLTPKDTITEEDRKFNVENSKEILKSIREKRKQEKN